MSRALLQASLAEAYGDVLPLIVQGVVARSVPALAAADPARFGLAVALPGGEVFGVGDYLMPFSVQSITKLFAFSLVLAADGDQIWSRLGREPSTHPYNSLLQLEVDCGIPRNPFVNAGALVTVDRLLELYDGDALGAVRGFLRAESGNPGIDVQPEVAKSELEHSHRNAALGHLVASYGNLRQPVAEVLEQYVGQCALEMSCADVALAGRYLAFGGLRADGSRLLTADAARRINATMLVCGMYDRAGEVAYRVGLPAKSGIGGGVLAVVPGRVAVCAWSPGLDASGNSVAGVAALEALAAVTGWSVF